MMLESLESRRLLSTYYVSTAGADAAAGNASHPWRTLQHAADTVAPGDTVIVTPGQYAGFDLWTSGRSTARITFSAQKGATITAPNHRTPDAINLEGASYITIQGFTIEPASGVTIRAGIRAVQDTNVIIRKNSVDHAGTWGIFTGFADNLLIARNTCTNSESPRPCQPGRAAFIAPRTTDRRSFGNTAAHPPALA